MMPDLNSTVKWSVKTVTFLRIKNGMAVVCEDEVRQIREIYEGYLSGLCYVAAAQKTGLRMNHGCVKRLLQNRHYLGDEFYPAIIEPEMFDAAEQERQRRSTLLGRDNKKKPFSDQIQIQTDFTMRKATKRVAEPFAQAEYLYRLIERREV